MKLVQIVLLLGVAESAQAFFWTREVECQLLPQGTVCASTEATWWQAPNPTSAYSNVPTPAGITSDYPSRSEIPTNGGMASDYPTRSTGDLYTTHYDYVPIDADLYASHSDAIVEVDLSLTYDNQCFIGANGQNCNSCRHCGVIEPNNVAELYDFDCTNLEFGRSTEGQCESAARIPDGKVEFLFPFTSDHPAVQTKAKGPVMEAVSVAGVDSASWTTVTLKNSFKSMVAVCSVKYNAGNDLKPAVVRMTNVGASSFDIKLQNPNGKDDSGMRSVYCVAMEEGKWTLESGRRIEGQKFQSSKTDGKGKLGWTGERKQYLHDDYKTPIVYGQVMSANDERWSVFWAKGGKIKSTPTRADLFVGKHVGEDKIQVRAPETIGFIVMDQGSETEGGIKVESSRTRPKIKDYLGKDQRIDFTTPFSAGPAVTIVSQAGMVGLDGSWAVLTSDPDSNGMGVAVDEDTLRDKERFHTAENVEYLAIEVEGSVALIAA
jgi:hypothetical protein